MEDRVRGSERLVRRLGLLLVFVLAGCAQETIAHQQLEREANRIVKLLKDKGIEAVKVKDEESRELRFNVLVPKDSEHESLTLLEQHNLPETLRPSTADIFGEGGMIPTTEQERAKRVVGIEGDLANGLRKLPRVIDAQVQVSIPEDNPLRDPTEEKPRPKASVFLVYIADSGGAPPVTTEDVQRIVYAKLPEIKATEVSVLLIPHRPNSGAGSTPTSVGGAMAPPIDPERGCVDKEIVIGIEVCAGNKRKIVNLVMIAALVAGLLAVMAVVAVLRAMRYRKDLTRLTAQFERVRK